MTDTGRKLAQVTAHDVARAAGVSQSAVSRAFTPGASISSERRARVLAAAARLGYQPNLIARSLTTNRSKIVGLAAGNLENPFFAHALDILSHRFKRAGLRLLLFPLDQPDMTVEEALQYRIDALVLLSTELTSSLATQCRLAGVPVILFNRRVEDPAISSVTGNNYGGAQTIAAFLLAGGHRRIAFMAGLEQSSTGRERQAGFCDYLAAAGAGAPLLDDGRFTHDAAAAAARRLFSRPDRPDAVFCANDLMALTTIDVARAEFGLEVGRQVSIVGFDDVPMAAWSGFSLTTYSQPVDEMCARTVDLLGRLQDDRTVVAHAVVEGRLVVRGSTRPVRPPKR